MFSSLLLVVPGLIFGRQYVLSSLSRLVRGDGCSTVAPLSISFDALPLRLAWRMKLVREGAVEGPLLKRERLRSRPR